MARSLQILQANTLLAGRRHQSAANVQPVDSAVELGIQGLQPILPVDSVLALLYDEDADTGNGQVVLSEGLSPAEGDGVASEAADILNDERDLRLSLLRRHESCLGGERDAAESDVGQEVDGVAGISEVTVKQVFRAYIEHKNEIVNTKLIETRKIDLSKLLY